MIEKKIHYCWFGGKPLPKKAKKCIKSWKKYFPDYEIIEWNETNFDVRFNEYAYQAYLNKKFAFFTDVARLYIIYNNGGLYFDVDVEVIKPFDDIIQCEAFFGIEEKGLVNTGLGFGAKKGNALVKKVLDDYEKINFVDKNGKMDLTPCPIRNSKIFIDNKFVLNNEVEHIDEVYIYPKIYFNPLNAETGTLSVSKTNTYSIHWYSGSWQSANIKIKKVLFMPIKKMLGMERFNRIKKIIKKGD